MFRITTGIESQLVLTEEIENENEELAGMMAIELERYQHATSDGEYNQ